MSRGLPYDEIAIVLLLFLGLASMAFVGVVWFRFDRKLRAEPKAFRQGIKQAILRVFGGGLGTGLSFSLIWLIGMADLEEVSLLEILFVFAVCAGGFAVASTIMFLISSTGTMARHEYNTQSQDNGEEKDGSTRG
jgi:hypothetical protein